MPYGFYGFQTGRFPCRINTGQEGRQQSYGIGHQKVIGREICLEHMAWLALVK